VAATGSEGHAASTSGTDGSFALRLPDGAYELEASSPGFAAAETEVTVRGAADASLELKSSGATLRRVPIYGGGGNVVADGTPGVFYLSGGNVGDLYRTTDWGGTWTQVTTAYDDPANGLSRASSPFALTTSGFPGEIAVVLRGADVAYSTDYGVRWHEVADSPAYGDRLLWGHAGSTSVLVDLTADGMYVADMTASSPRFVRMTEPYPYTRGTEAIGVGNGADKPWVATADDSGHVSLFPLVASASAPRPITTLSGFPTDALVVGLGGRSAPGAPPAGLVVATVYQAAVSLKAPGAQGYPPPRIGQLGQQCWSPAVSPQIDTPAIAPDTGASYGSAWVGGCWLQESDGNVTVKGAYGAGAAIDAGYDATASSPGTDRVVMLDPLPPEMAQSGGVGVTKLAGTNGGFPVTLANPTASARPGLDPSSSGAAVDGITAATVRQTTFGPLGQLQLASATDVASAASDNGGSSFVRASYGHTWSVAWWQGASGTWLLFGQSASRPNDDLVAGFENWTNRSARVTGPNVAGSSLIDFGGPNFFTPVIVDAIAGVPGQDTAFIGVGVTGTISGPNAPAEAGVRRVSISTGPSFSHQTPIGDGIIRKPGPLAYCPSSSAASSVEDVLFVMADDNLGGALYRVTGATGPSPAVTKVVDIPAAQPGAVFGLPTLQVDCASGTVWAGTGATQAGLLQSTDGGQTFNTVSVDDPTGDASEQIRALALTPGDPGSITVGDSEGFIQRSNDAGRTWTLLNDPATDLNLSYQANLSGGIWDLASLPSFGPLLASADPAAALKRLARRRVLIAGPGEFAGDPATRAVPRVTAFWVTHPRFSVGTSPTATNARRGARSGRGTTFMYALSLPGTVSIVIHRAGRRTAAGTLTRWSRARLDAVSFSGRIGHRALPPGTYIATIAARIGHGRKSRSRTVAFTIVRG
jgi:hypothetical protein